MLERITNPRALTYQQGFRKKLRVGYNVCWYFKYRTKSKSVRTIEAAIRPRSYYAAP